MEHLNNNIEKISEYPFKRLKDLLAEVKNKNKKFETLDLSIGQPHHKFPDFVKETLIKQNSDWSKYPPLNGIPSLRKSYMSWLKKAF